MWHYYTDIKRKEAALIIELTPFLIQYRYVLYIWILRYLKDGICYMILYDNILAF